MPTSMTAGDHIRIGGSTGTATIQSVMTAYSGSTHHRSAAYPSSSSIPRSV
ncbi:hypothetical protein [Saccharothrix carnea]|uniref:hypothetical protein n=1 Tax=Saccharothrix carnea TaxID=1280637 RepID=UPI0015E72DF1|nr:hypothetical protein [Saccharothrix carnea]